MAFFQNSVPVYSNNINFYINTFSRLSPAKKPSLNSKNIANDWIRHVLPMINSFVLLMTSNQRQDSKPSFKMFLTSDIRTSQFSDSIISIFKRKKCKESISRRGAQSLHKDSYEDEFSSVEWLELSLFTLLSSFESLSEELVWSLRMRFAFLNSWANWFPFTCFFMRRAPTFFFAL